MIWKKTRFSASLKTKTKKIEEYNRIIFWNVRKRTPQVFLKYGTFFLDFHIVNICIISYGTYHINQTRLGRLLLIINHLSISMYPPFVNVLTFTDVWFFVVLHPTREYFTHMETSPLPMKDFKFWTILGTHGHWPVRHLYHATPTETRIICL